MNQTVGINSPDRISYQAEIAAVADSTTPSPGILASIIVVSYCANGMLLECLDSLFHQQIADNAYEIILVDNGGNEAVHDRLKGYPIRHLRLRRNLGCSVGKNIGALAAKAEIVCFMDDDALADPGFVSAHIRAYREMPWIVGARGKVLPKNLANIYNGLAWHYDLGNCVVPAYIDTETNASFLRQPFLEAGGFSSPMLRGDTEGASLSLRLASLCGDTKVLVYYPEAVVYHDFAASLSKLTRKTFSQAAARRALVGDGGNSDGSLMAYLGSYRLPGGTVHVPRNAWSRIRLKIVREYLQLLKFFQCFV